MIQYIVAAGLGALIGSAQKGKKNYRKGGSVMKKDPDTKREILRESDGIMDDADDLIRIADKKRLDRDDKMGIQTLADEMKFRAGNIYDTAQRKLAKGGRTTTQGLHKFTLPAKMVAEFGLGGSERKRDIYHDRANDRFYMFDFDGDLEEILNYYPIQKLRGLVDLMTEEGIKGYAKGGTTSDKPKVTSISESLMKMDGEVVQWEDMDNARLMFGPAMNAQDVADALIEHDIFLEEYAPELYEGYMEDDTDLFVHDGITPTLKDSVDIDDIVDAIEDHRKIKGDNSYNYSAPFVFDYKYVQTDDPYDEQLYFVREHRGGDVRGNYGQYMAFQLDSVEEHPLYGRISVYLETDKGDVTLDSESIEGYNYEVIKDETGTFEEYENVNADDIEEAFDFGKLKSDALNIFARGGRTKRRKMAQGGLAIHFDDDYTHKDEIENLLMSKTYMRDNENLTDYGSSFYVYADDIGTSGVRDVYNLIVEEGYDDNVELRPFAKGGKTQGYNARLDESLAMRRGAKRTKKQGYESRRHESEGMERSMGRRKYASVGTMDKGRRRMAHGGTTGREVITYNFYNIDGDVIRSGDSIVDYDKETITLPNGKTYKVKDDYEYTMKWQKTQVKAIGGIHGLVKTIKEFSSPDSPFNTSYAVKFAPKEMAKGGCTSCGKRGRKMAHGGQVPDYLLDELSSQTGLRKSAVQKLVKDNHFSKDDVVSIVTGIGRGQIEPQDVAMAFLMGLGSTENEELVEFPKSGKAFDMARGGKTQGYNARLDESLSMRHGAGRKKEQGRKDRRDESEAMERSMRRRKYASVDTMDMGRRKMEDGGMVEYLLYGVAKGKPEYMEKVLFVDDKPIRITEKLRDMASAKGFDRLRTSMVDLKIAPDFTKALNFKKGGKTKGRKKVSDFDKLAMKVAARYRAQGMSNKKAMEIGRGTAGKVARQQQAKKRKK